MKNLYLFSAVGLIIASLFLDLDKQSTYICWGIGAFLFALYSPAFMFGVGILVGGSIFAMPLFNNGNGLLGFIIIIVICIVGGYFLLKGVKDNFE
mgnify:CR=1 FL=1